MTTKLIHLIVLQIQRMLLRSSAFLVAPTTIAAVTCLFALSLRLAHVLTTARAITAGDSISFEVHARNFLRT